ncbi:MAG TPA: DNA polymerase IV, partial [Syntrophales bacterium]|nr:DNA polymerase IV [Syntrophales bacterium]
LRVEKVERLYAAADRLAEKYGKHTLHLGGSHLIERVGKGKRGEPTARETTRLPGESGRRHLGLPILHLDV